jgi:hypothetical protein
MKASVHTTHQPRPMKKSAANDFREPYAKKIAVAMPQATYNTAQTSSAV